MRIVEETLEENASISVVALRRVLPEHAPEALDRWLAAGQGTPVAPATGALETMLSDAPRTHLAALILADAALVQVTCLESFILPRPEPT
ncbi:hypothetical protein BMI89_20100 [Thioclava sp. F36-7]|nr:hypothetical protein BMI89_20100 [Thioclava sp. F36-7]